MRGETQAVHLAKIMQKQKHHPEYELALPLVKIKKSSIKKIMQGDVVLLGFTTMDMILLLEEKVCAHVILVQENKSRKIEIILADEHVYTNDNKKYEILKCSFGIVQSRKIEVGHKIDISSLSMSEVSLTVKNKTIALGSLVNVDDEIAIQIKEVTQ